MPKKTPRGGRYTTGIKKTSSGGYGGQTYGRRGCLSVVLVVPLLLVGGCAGALGETAIMLGVVLAAVGAYLVMEARR